MAEKTRVCRLGLYWESFNISRSWESSAKWPFSTIRSASSITRHLQNRQATSLVSATAGKKNLYMISHSHPSHILSFTHTYKHPTIAIRASANFSRACKDRAWMAKVFCDSEKALPIPSCTHHTPQAHLRR